MASAARERPVLQADPLGVAARGDQAGEHVGGHVLPGRLAPGPGHADPAVVPVAARRSSSAPTGPASAQLSSCVRRGRLPAGARSRLTSPRAAGSNAVRTIPASLGGAWPGPARSPRRCPALIPGRAASGRPRRRAAVRSGGRGGAQLRVEGDADTRVSTSAAAAGAALTSWPMICRAASGAAGSSAAATESARAMPGSGAVSMVTVTQPHHGQVAERCQPAAPVRDPRVGVCAVGQPGGGGDHPQRRGHQPGAAVQHDAVPAAVAVLGVQQRQRGQHPGQSGTPGNARPRPRPGSGCSPRASRTASATAAARPAASGSPPTRARPSAAGQQHRAARRTAARRRQRRRR